MKPINTKYTLESVKTGEKIEETGWTLDANEKDPTLIRAIYEHKQLTPKGEDFGLYTFADWLPVYRMLEGSSAPLTYKSEGLAKKLGLKNLYITFSGHWPEKGGRMKTCSFKETEAYSVCGRMKFNDKILVVASAGNTARAFAKVCSDNQIPLLLSVPEDNIDALWFDKPINDCVKLIVSEKGSDYYDAIHLSNIACKSKHFIAEGGAKNVARRDGMATTMLSASLHIGKIPDYYFQAIGSGTGAVAAWEANLRLIEDGRFGNHKAKLMVSQNKPFTPIYDAWKADSRPMLPLDDNLAREQVEIIIAKVLSNRKPPYTIYGGLYDALKDTNGEVLLADNEELKEANKIFIETEGIDIHPAASIAVATLIKTAKENKINKEANIMLNITGGGEERFKKDNKVHYLKPSLHFKINPDEEDVIKQIEKLFNK